MPYLKVTCARLPAERKAEVARQLTEAVNLLFFSPRGGPSREELREHTTVHFSEFRDEDLYIGGRTPRERGRVDLTAELSDWNMSVRKQRRVARHLTPVLARLFGMEGDLDGINLRFHSYPPRDFAVGGRLLSDRVPWIGQVLKRRAG
ncbi:tautomerase family protein [Deinococcus budaensis]|uniref:Phenylpyruvate tautomerase PptA (4-oxalocrotonate tautomerase family) n=1 Tax=Deinococcus budaensis TaxID=1665626 RepID=A0A7W8LNM5_9DEIO|nr:hypothetical protein [Deinococcus budaensis]MBB5232717.1 phenylpyruvate tautomerase PptA (4-oxalocrotonate tautomerase family) [Deinococcus budaensis]